MTMTQEWTLSTVESLSGQVVGLKAEGWQFVQLCAIAVEGGADLLYTFRREGALRNVTVPHVTPEDTVASITPQYPAAFVFENEAHDLYGVRIQGISVDFHGKFYKTAVPTPMAQLAPELEAARKKARAAEAAKAAKAHKAAGGPAGSEGGASGIEAKLAAMDPEKAAKARAALERKRARAGVQNQEGVGQ